MSGRSTYDFNPSGEAERGFRSMAGMCGVLAVAFAVAAVVATLHTIDSLNNLPGDRSWTDYVTAVGSSAGGYLAAMMAALVGAYVMQALRLALRAQRQPIVGTE